MSWCMASAAAAAVLLLAGAQATPVDLDGASSIVLSGRGPRLHPTKPIADARRRGLSAPAYAPFVYGGGSVMLNPTLYYLWYGDWSSADSAVTILRDLASSIAGTPWLTTVTTYYEIVGNHQSNCTSTVTFGGDAFDSYSQGTFLTTNSVATAIDNQMGSGYPRSTNAIYLMLASPDVNISGFCTEFCGWHSAYSIGSNNYVFGFIGGSNACPNSCTANGLGSPTPNGDLQADSMASIISHELVESTTDPVQNAWIDASGNECADRCAWLFGNTYTSNGAPANVQWGDRNYLIQMDWLNWGSLSNCVQGWGALPSSSGTPTVTPSKSGTPSHTPSNSPTPSHTPSNTPTPSHTPSNSPTPSNTPSLTPTGSVAVSNPAQVVAILSLAGCSTDILRGSGTTGLALRALLAAAAGLPTAQATLEFVYCAGGNYVAVEPTDAANMGSGGRRLGGAQQPGGPGRRLPQNLAASMYVVASINTTLPQGSSALGSGTTGLAVAPSLSTSANVAARVLALSGTVGAEYAAAAASAGLTISLNAAAIASATGVVSADWAAAAGVSPGPVGFVSAAHSPASPSATPAAGPGSANPLSWGALGVYWIAVVIAGGLVIIAAFGITVCVVRRRNARRREAEAAAANAAAAASAGAGGGLPPYPYGPYSQAVPVAVAVPPNPGDLMMNRTQFDEQERQWRQHQAARNMQTSQARISYAGSVGGGAVRQQQQQQPGGMMMRKPVDV